MSVPVQPDRDLARAWANQELAHREYQAARPSLFARAVNWLWDQLGLLDLGRGASSVVGLLIVSGLVATLIGFLLWRAGGLHRTARREGAAVLPSQHTTAADHRAAADRYAAAGQWDQALVERFRAIARELEERALLRPQPGRTAREVAKDGGQALPEQAAGLLSAAGYFDDVCYGHLSPGRDADLAVRELDEQIRAATPVGVR